MVDLRKNVANQFAKQTLSKAKDALGIEDNQTTASNGSGQGPNGQEGPINWQNYNYPPLIRLVHYSTDYLRQPHLGLAKKIHACAILVFVNQLLNLLNNIIEVSVDCPAIKSVVVLYSVLNVGIITFAAMFSFVQGYYAICQGPSHGRKLWLYRVSQVVLCIAYFVFSIVGGSSPFDGWVKFKVLSECGLGFSIFLAVVQNLIYLIACGLGLYNVWAVGKAYGQYPFQNEPVASHTNEDNQGENKGGFGERVIGFGKKALGSRDRQDDEI